MKRLFSYENINGDPVESRHAALTPYLFDAGSAGEPAFGCEGGVATSNGLQD